MNTFIAVALVIRGQGRQHSKFDPRGIAVLLDRADNFDGTSVFSLFIIGLNHLSKGTLTE